MLKYAKRFINFIPTTISTIIGWDKRGGWDKTGNVMKRDWEKRCIRKKYCRKCVGIIYFRETSRCLSSAAKHGFVFCI